VCTGEAWDEACIETRISTSINNCGEGFHSWEK
jgi:hypothetical protein